MFHTVQHLKSTYKFISVEKCQNLLRQFVFKFGQKHFKIGLQSLPSLFHILWLKKSKQFLWGYERTIHTMISDKLSRCMFKIKVNIMISSDRNTYFITIVNGTNQIIIIRGNRRKEGR